MSRRLYLLSSVALRALWLAANPPPPEPQAPAPNRAQRRAGQIDGGAQ